MGLPDPARAPGLGHRAGKARQVRRPAGHRSHHRAVQARNPSHEIPARRHAAAGRAAHPQAGGWRRDRHQRGDRQLHRHPPRQPARPAHHDAQRAQDARLLDPGVARPVRIDQREGAGPGILGARAHPAGLRAAGRRDQQGRATRSPSTASVRTAATTSSTTASRTSTSTGTRHPRPSSPG